MSNVVPFKRNIPRREELPEDVREALATEMAEQAATFDEIFNAVHHRMESQS
jgi:hypothetical protein